MSKKFLNISRRYTRLSPFLRIYVFPLGLGTISLLISSYGNLFPQYVQYILISLWVIFSWAHAVMLNVNIGEANHLKHREEAVSSILDNTNQCVKEKQRRLDDVIRQAHRSDVRLIGALRNSIRSDNSIIFINAGLFRTISQYLNTSARLQGAHLSLSLLKPDEAGNCILVSPYEVTPGSTRGIPRKTRLNIHNKASMGGRLWNDKDNVILTTGNTFRSEKSGEFSFFTEQERNDLKSLFCYKILDPSSRDPIALWCLEANEYDVLPEYRDIKTKYEITEIFHNFEIRLNLEFSYDKLSKITQDILKR